MNFVNQLVLNGQINDIGEFIRVNSGESYRMGIEIDVFAKILEKWEVSANTTFSKNENIDFRNEAISGIENLGNTPISFSPNIIANLLINFRPTKNFNVGLQNQYVGNQFLDNTHHKNLRLSSYFLTDFNAQYSLLLNKSEFDFKLLINNIFDKKYVNNGFVYENNPYYFSQAGINFLFGLSFKFPKR